MSVAAQRAHWNGARFEREAETGHYESWFLRANHPTRPLAFWIRYTIFAPRHHADATVGQLWAIVFDGESGRHVAVKQAVPIDHCSFAPGRLNVHIGAARLVDGAAEGTAASGAHHIAWALDWSGDASPLLLLPERFYRGGFPKAKALVPRPNAQFRGRIGVDGSALAIDGWQGSENHNWGSRHTHAYAWGQVAGFDDAADAFLELATARTRLGPFWTPWLTPIVLRLNHRDYALNGLDQARRNRGRFEPFTWDFAARDATIDLQGRIEAPASAFVALAYENPPGGSKICLNSKIARCELTVARPGDAPRRLVSAHRAAFEILADAPVAGVPVAV